MTPERIASAKQAWSELLAASAASDANGERTARDRMNAILWVLLHDGLLDLAEEATRLREENEWMREQCTKAIAIIDRFGINTHVEAIAEFIRAAFAKKGTCATCGGSGDVLCGDQFYRDCPRCKVAPSKGPR